VRHIKLSVAVAVSALLAASCGGGGGSVAQGSFALIEFLESGKDSIPRNRVLTFRFSAPVAEGQDFFERLQIENVQVGGGGSNFSTAIGLYLVSGETVTFVPRLPEKGDRSDAGFRSNGEYTVFLKAGPDSLRSTEGDRLGVQQEHIFNTSDFFEDPVPSEPPRALGLVSRDPNTGAQDVVLDRLEVAPSELAGATNDELIAAGRVIEPGAGAGFGAPWQFDLIVSEPVDPATVTTKNVEMFEIFESATDSGEVAPPSGAANGFGDPVDFKVPINVEAVQELNPDGTSFLAIRVTPLFTLVDNTRYRIVFSGNILGIDFRKAFIGENGLTGDGTTTFEPGGLGYVSEFIVRDRGAITGTRTLTYEPLVDGIQPEQGQTTSDEDKLNTALYDPSSNPSQAVGFLPDFGNGTDGSFSVAGGNTVTIDTGDTANEAVGNPFTVQDLNPNDLQNPQSVNPQPVTYDSPSYFEMNLASLTVSSSSTLRVIGVNPVLFRVTGIVQINGALDVSGEDGQGAGGATAFGGAAGAGGSAGGDSQRGAACNPGTSACQTFDAIISSCSGISNNGGPFAQSGEGPGRGMGGGEAFGYIYHELTSGLTGTGGGGGSHATAGTPGEDRYNASGAPGTPGPACAQGSSAGTSPTRWAKNSSVIGVRGQPGDTYGDREVIAVLWGGSGGGGGGSQHIYISFAAGASSGGGGGGGGGSLAIFAAGSILVSGGIVDASGGDGGRGVLVSPYSPQPAWRKATGGGGGGSGGSLVLISGSDINVAAGILDASGGTGGVRANVGTSVNTCNGCNAGGDGGKGFIFLMDADGQIDGLNPSAPGEYDEFASGVLTISEFTTERFSSIAAVTELFNVLAANPDFTDTLPSGDVSATVAAGQRLRIFMSSARSDAQEPLAPDQVTETGTIEVAVVEASPGGGVAVNPVAGAMAALNPDGAPARDAFLRIDARFEYFEDGVEAALGPFITIDVVTVTYTFNG